MTSFPILDIEIDNGTKLRVIVMELFYGSLVSIARLFARQKSVNFDWQALTLRLRDLKHSLCFAVRRKNKNNKSAVF